MNRIDRAEAKDAIWDAMSEARDLQVRKVGADSNSITYRISLDVVFDRAMQRKISDAAGSESRRVTSTIARYAKAGLTLFFRDDDKDAAVSGDQVEGT